MYKFMLFICFSVSPYISSLFAQQSIDAANGQTITWPSEYEPSKSAFYVHNEIEINAAPETVWAILTDALQWPLWYKGAADVSFENIDDSILTPNSIINWNTMGLKFQSFVKEYEPHKILAWESKKKSIRGYHVWLIIPTENGCKVITDESQNGWLTFFEKIFQRNKLSKLHNVWLINLKQKAENEESK